MAQRCQRRRLHSAVTVVCTAPLPLAAQRCQRRCCHSAGTAVGTAVGTALLSLLSSQHRHRCLHNFTVAGCTGLPAS
eukprot:5351840-Pleurochrysis_carterae.AAC.1